MLEAQYAEAEGSIYASSCHGQGKARSLLHRPARPYDGVIGNLAVETGDMVTPGQRLAALVPVDTLYIVANFKETQLARQLVSARKVQVTVDAMSDNEFEGTVASLAPASGAVFSLLPPENATGNFTKVVQRVPVRIDMPADALASGSFMPACRSSSTSIPARRPAAIRTPLRGRVMATAQQRSEVRGTSRSGRAYGSAEAFAFLAMVFGMFMAILDIQIVSASLSEIQAGLSASSDEISWVQTAYLIAEVIMIPLSGFLARAAVDAHPVHRLGGRLHRRQRAVRHRHEHRPDDRLPRDPGLHRRRHDPERVRRRLHDLPAVEARHRLADDRPRRDAGADHRPDGRRLSEPAFSWHWLFLVNVVPGIAGRQRRWTLIDFDKPDRGLLQEVRLVGPCRHGGVPRLARICARGRPATTTGCRTTASVLFSIVLGRRRVVFFCRVLHARRSRSSTCAPSATSISPSARCSPS